MLPSGDGCASGATMTPEAISSRARRRVATAAAAIGCAAFPKAKSDNRWPGRASKSRSASAVMGPGAAPSTAASYRSTSSARPLAGAATRFSRRASGERSITSERGSALRECLLHGGFELVVRRLRELVERSHAVRDASTRVDDEQVAVVHATANGAVPPTHRLPDVAAEEDRCLKVARPRCEGSIRVHAHGEDHDVATTAEELGVLITVRLHLHRSALGPCLVEEAEHDRLATKVGQAHRVTQHAVARGAR